MVSDKVFTTDGTQKIFSSDFDVISEDHIRVFLDGTVVSRDDYDLINNAAVFFTPPTSGQTLTLQVGTTPADILTSPTDAGIVAANIADVNTVAANIADVNDVQDSIADVNTVAGNIADVNTVAGIDADVTAVANNDTNVTTVADNISSVNTVATNINEVITVANDLTEAISEVETVADDLNEAVSEIETVAANITNVDLVGTDISNVNTVATDIANVNTTATDITNVNTVATDITNVNTVATDITNVNTVATNISDVNDAYTNATNAAASAAAAATSATAASQSATSASQSATSAATSASNALTSQNAAQTYASNALTSANNASTSETNAATSETNAAASEANASASATAAAASAANAALAYDQFDDRYLGSKSADPAVDNDGNALVVGALYFNTTDGVMKVYTASGWVNASSSLAVTFDRFMFTATSGQTAFTGTDDNGETLTLAPDYVMVTLNGITLEYGADFTATSSTITLTSGATVGDELNVYAFSPFEVADVYTRAQADANFVSPTGNVTLTNKTIDDISNDIGADHVHLKVRNETGSTINAGVTLKVTGWAVGHNCITVAPCSTAGDVAIGMTYAAIPNNTNAAVTNTGVIADINTSSYSVGDILYTTGNGTLTTTKPTNGDYQTIGYALRSHSSEGVIFVEFTEPNGISLPDQTGHAGQYLTTDGTTADWDTIDTDANTTTKGLYEHAHTISANYTITSGNNAMSAGPVTVDTGYSVTVPSGSVWTIV